MTATSSKDWDRKRAGELIDGMKAQPAALLPILHALQAEFGFIPELGLPLIAAALNLSRAEVHGVVSFYHDFRDTPPGRHVLRLCRAEACQSMGADALADETRKRLGVEWGGTSSDGRVTLEPVFCLGLCACAPAAMFDGKVLGALDSARLGVLIDEACKP